MLYINRWLLLLIIPIIYNYALASEPKIETEDEGVISINSFNNLLQNYSDNFYWIDVRDHEEVAFDGTHAQARIIPMAKFEAEIANLPADKPIIFFCNTGARAGEAYDFVQMKRKNLQVYFLDANLSFNKQPLPKVTPVD
jgi:rhodanese-related sulfurtransferase